MTGGGFILEIDNRRLPLGESRLVVGRDAGCDVVIDDPSVSSLHARFERGDAGWLLTDENSLNGTLLGGLRMRPGIPRLVTAEAEIRFGTVSAKVRAQIPVTAGVSTVESAMAMLQALNPSQERGPSVHVVEGTEIGREILLKMDETAVVGRSPKADIVIAAEAVSLRHLEIRRTPSGVMVRDVGSRHGTELAGRRLPLNDWSIWEAGLCLSLARSVVVLMLERERTVDDIDVMSNPMLPKRSEPVPEKREASIPAVDEKGESGAVYSPVASARPQQAEAAPMVPRPATEEKSRPASSANALVWGGAVVFVLTALALVWLLRA